MTSSTKHSTFRHLIGNLTGADQIRMEKNRLEAFLAAVPGEYCGFSTDGDILFSKNFPILLGINKVEGLQDILSAFSGAEAIVFENAFTKLKNNGDEFSLNIKVTASQKVISITGTQGLSLDSADRFYILWLKDMTEETSTLEKLSQDNALHNKTIERFKIILETLNKPVWLRDGQGNLLWVNHAYCQMVESHLEKVIEKQIEILIKPKAKLPAKTPKELAQESIQTKKIQQLEGYITHTGKRLYVRITEQPVSQHVMSLGILEDVSELEEIIADYNRSATAHKALLEQLRTAIALYNSEQKLEFYNTAFSQLWDLPDQWLNSKPKLGDILEKLRETRHLPEQADFRNYKQSWLTMFTNLIDPHDDMMYLPDGKALRFLVIPNPSGGLMMTFEDVTSRLELESSYNTLIAVQKETLDNLAEGVAVFGGDGRLKLYNPSFAELWHLNPEDVENNPHITKLTERMAVRYKQEEQVEYKHILISHGIERRVQEGRMTLGNAILLEFATVPLPDGGVMVSYFDVTDSTKVENALREKNAALETAELLKTDFLANVSYQLRTPLNAIMGFAEILSNQFFGALNDKQKEYSHSIQEAGEKLVHLIDDILDLSTIEAGYMELSYESFDIHKMLQDLMILTANWASKEDLLMHVSCSPTIGVMTADQRRIKQVMLNLIRNAINFTPKGGTIEIGAIDRKDSYHLYIRDTGIGIAKTDLERIFQPFERAIHEHRADMSPHALSRGAGLGLALVKNIVSLHEGSVAIESEEGKGTLVTITLPKKPLLEADIEINDWETDL